MLPQLLVGPEQLLILALQRLAVGEYFFILALNAHVRFLDRAVVSAEFVVSLQRGVVCDAFGGRSVPVILAVEVQPQEILLARLQERAAGDRHFPQVCQPLATRSRQTRIG